MANVPPFYSLPNMYLQPQQMYIPNYHLPINTLNQGHMPSFTSLPNYMSPTHIPNLPAEPIHQEQRLSENQAEVESEPNREYKSESPLSATLEYTNIKERESYLAELNKEKEYLSQSQISRGTKGSGHVLQILEREISLVQSGHAVATSNMDKRMLDIYSGKPIRISVKVTVPVKEHPKFNFVGKILGPKGNSLKRLQEDTLTKMAVLGKGSMRDRAREEDLRLSKDPKYIHLSEELHVEITAFAPPAEAYARLSYALTELRKYLIPDSNDQIRQLQMKELEILSNTENLLSDPKNPGQFSNLLTTVSPMQSLNPLLVPNTNYYLAGDASKMPSLLPTPPLDPIVSTGSASITAPPTKYTETQESLVTVTSQVDMGGNQKMSNREEHIRERRAKTNPY